eukprot:675601-Rhodomonas_salina.2
MDTNYCPVQKSERTGEGDLGVEMCLGFDATLTRRNQSLNCKAAVPIRGSCTSNTGFRIEIAMRNCNFACRNSQLPLVETLPSGFLLGTILGT